MSNEYNAPEIVEIGDANEIILGAKPFPDIDESTESTLTDGDLDE